jgi:hypothetical protein
VYVLRQGVSAGYALLRKEVWIPLSNEKAEWAVGYAVGLAEGMDKLRALRAAVRSYLEENPLPARNPEARAELLRLIKQD